MARALNIDAKEDGEISDDYNDSDDDDDDSNRSHSPAFQRKQIVYEIDDDSSSNHSDRQSPYNEFSGEWLTQFTRVHTNKKKNKKTENSTFYPLTRIRDTFYKDRNSAPSKFVD